MAISIKVELTIFRDGVPTPVVVTGDDVTEVILAIDTLQRKLGDDGAVQ